VLMRATTVTVSLECQRLTRTLSKRQSAIRRLAKFS
jgi:hypothetical protein